MPIFLAVNFYLERWWHCHNIKSMPSPLYIKPIP
jgi:hypothetical protein